MKWTKQQQQVVELRGRNLLVSAAAGSGKTAVLVERIIQKITDRKHPVDIDSLLIVTFTNAAAAEMRERIGAAIEAALEEQPDNAHLQKQQTLLHNAQITTIHSFCLYVIRNYFHRIELDPDFRMAEEGELKLLKSDVQDQVLEGYYAEGRPEFLVLSETIATGKNDLPLKDTILKLFEFAMSYPWVEQWLRECQKSYEIASLEEFEALPMTEELESYLNSLSTQWALQLKGCRTISMEEDGPYMYTPMLEQEAAALEALAVPKTYVQYYEAIRSFSFGRLAAARNFTGDILKKEQVQKMRNEVKSSMKKVTEQFFFQSPAAMVEDIRRNKPVAEMLIEVTLSFMHKYAEKKREKHILDFNDLEHFALQILAEEGGGQPTKTALEIQKNYEEIMIDEYQDSNYVQETILKAVSGVWEGRYNIFMVGDVKQSIYRFRMARPELFMEKYNAYSQEEGEKQRIDLYMNFRSRPEVLTTVNDVFYKIMKEDIGNITYDSQAALYPGASFTEAVPGMFDTRILVIEPEEKNQDIKGRELEAKAVGNEIVRLMEEQLVTDKVTGTLRPVNYSDMVILLRSMSGWSEVFQKELGELGIPVKAATGTGYFSAAEVQTALNLLRLIDNPRQDIPMVAVLASPIVGLTGEELAILKTEALKDSFYLAAMKYKDRRYESKLPESKKEKLFEFFGLLEAYRNKVSYTPIHELLYQILVECGYLGYVYALPGGEVKKANLEMLVEKAIAYEATSYRGLFHFIRYMEQLQKYDVDFALADAEESGNMVRIMSIHKSKGLEFPVVFVSGLGKLFNNQDTREKVVLHPRLGFGMDVVDIKRRLRTPGLTRQFLAKKAVMENIGEELRILYVALTRAKEKLILTGTMKKAQEKLETMTTAVSEDGFLTFLSRQNANSFLGFLLPALACYGEKYPITLIRQEEIGQSVQKQTLKGEMSRLQLLGELQKREPEWEEKIRQRLSFCYPFEGEAAMRTKVSVSELKHRAMDRILEEEGSFEWKGQSMQEHQEERYVPAFMEGEQQENRGAMRGTAVHRILECYDFLKEKDTLHRQLVQLEELGRIEPEMLELLDLPVLEKFLNTPLAARMRKAAENGKLYKEKPFVMGNPAKEVLENCSSEEMVLIQGIIDVFFEEEGKIVLLDYKTDRVKSSQELAKRYQAQLDLYQEAIERATGKPVKEKLLYSFCLGETVSI